MITNKDVKLFVDTLNKIDADKLLNELIEINANSLGPSIEDFCNQFKQENTTIYLFRYSYCSCGNSDITMYSKELTTENVRKFLMLLPPFKENWTTEYETKFMDQIDLYKVEDENFIYERYKDDEDQLFLKIEDEHFDNHWCYVRKVEML